MPFCRRLRDFLLDCVDSMPSRLAFSEEGLVVCGCYLLWVLEPILFRLIVLAIGFKSLANLLTRRELTYSLWLLGACGINETTRFTEPPEAKVRNPKGYNNEKATTVWHYTLFLFIGVTGLCSFQEGKAVIK